MHFTHVLLNQIDYIIFGNAAGKEVGGEMIATRNRPCSLELTSLSSIGLDRNSNFKYNQFYEKHSFIQFDLTKSGKKRFSLYIIIFVLY